MKLTTMLLIAGFLNVSANGVSQSITFSGKNASLNSVFLSVKKQTGFVFLYVGPVLKVAKPVTISANDMPLESFLKEVFKEQALDYSIKGQSILVTPKTDFDQQPSSPGTLNILNDTLITVRGRIINERGEPVVASVIIKGSTFGTTTDADGQFVLFHVDNQATLLISGVSIEPMELKLNGRSEFSFIKVLTKITAQEEVTVNAGYYKVQERQRTGSIFKVTAKEIEKQPVSSPLMALQGRVPGLEITPQSGMAGGAPTIRVRGNNSLRSGRVGDGQGNFPLYIIDGIPVSSLPVGAGASMAPLGFDPISTLNPGNIASIEVLKDADATAIYGSRGANGVILITTKEANGTGKTNVDINIYKGAGKVSQKLDLLNTQQYLEMRKEAFANEGAEPQSYHYDLKVWDSTRYTDWQKELIGNTSQVTNAQVAISGGNANTSYRLGAAHYSETMVTPGDFGYKRSSGFIQLNHRSSNNKFVVTGTANYGVENNQLFLGDLVSQALNTAPNAPALYDADGKLNWEQRDFFGFLSSTFLNPLAILDQTSNSKSNNLLSNFQLNYELIKGLVLKSSFGYTAYHQTGFSKTPTTTTQPEYRSFVTPSNSFSFNDRQSWIVEPQINYSREIGDHSFNIVAGATWQQSKAESKAFSGLNYASDDQLNSLQAAGLLITTNENYTDYKYTAGFARIGYDYRGTYFLNLTGRRDGSSRFGPGKRFGNFGAIGAAWIFTNEKLFNNSFLSFGKIRASYGTTGNDQLPDYSYYNLFTSSSNYNGSPGLTPGSLYNPALQWETTNKLEAALQLGLAKDRINIEAAYYRNRSSNQLLIYSLPGTTGFPGIFLNFPATIQNKGWEIVINSKNFRTNSFSWSSSLNISFPRNKLVKFDNIETSSYASIYKVGEPLSIMKLYTWEGVDPATGKHVVADLNNDGDITEDDKKFMLPSITKYYGGINNAFSFKSVELNFLFQFSRMDNNFTLAWAQPGHMGNQPVSVLNRWRKPGDITDVEQFTEAYDPNDRYNNIRGNSNYTFQKIFMARLKTLTLSWQLPKTVISPMKMKGISVFIQGQNLLTFDNSKNLLDPETGNTLPPLRIITGGLNLNF